MTFKDFFGVSDNEAENEGDYTGGEVTLNDNYVRNFANIYREQYENSDHGDVLLEDYLNQLYTSGEFTHKSNQPIKEFISGIIDALPVAGQVKNILNKAAGKDIVTGDGFTLSEVKSKTFRAVVDIVAAEFSLGKMQAEFNGTDPIEIHSNKVTSYPHVYVYDKNGNLLDVLGNIVDRKSPDGHIPYKN